MKRILLVLAAIAVVAVFVSLVFADFAYHAVRSGPALEPGAFNESFPHAQIYLDPDAIRPTINDLVHQHVSAWVPSWAVGSVLPWRGWATFTADHDAREVGIHAVANLRRLGPLLRDRLNNYDVLNAIPGVDWEDGGLALPRRGALTAAGRLPMEPEAEEEAWFEWDHPVYLTPLERDGGHFVEIVLDNRDGGAYILFMSLIDAYDWNLNPQEKDIGIATMIFVETVRVYMDPQPNDTLRVVLAFEIVPEAKNRIAIHSLREAVDEGLAALKRRLADQHNIRLSGEDRWEDNILVFEYRLEQFTRAVDLVLQGRIF